MGKPANVLSGDLLTRLNGGLDFGFRIGASCQKSLQPLAEPLWTAEGEASGNIPQLEIFSDQRGRTSDVSLVECSEQIVNDSGRPL